MIIVDGSSLMFRSAYTRDEPVMIGENNAAPIRGFVQYLMFLAGEFDASDGFIVAWDRKLVYGTESFRKQLAAQLIGERQYKSGRPTGDQNNNVFFCCDHVPEFLTAIGIINLYPHSLEADDAIAWAVKNLKYNRATVVSGDSDLWQLIDDNVDFYSPVKKQLITKDQFHKEQGYPLDKYLLYKAIVGDTSDKIPGVPGMGKVRTTKYINSLAETGPDPAFDEIVNRNMQLMDLTHCLSLCPTDIAEFERQYEEQKALKVDIAKFTALSDQYSLPELASQKNISKINERFGAKADADELNALFAAFQ